MTGDRGSVGRWLRPYLRRRGWEVQGFDLRDGRDIRDAEAVRGAAAASDAILHCATLPWDFPGSDEELAAVNVGGAANVLAAGEAAGHERAVIFSSPHVFGVFNGERDPAWLPLSDDLPRKATLAYGRSKVAVEDMCAEFTARTGIATFCPRPLHVWTPGQAADLRRKWARSGSEEWQLANLGAFLDVRDLCAAVELCLGVPAVGHHRFLLAAPDTGGLLTAGDLVRRSYADVPRRVAIGDSLVDSGVARQVLGWAPRYGWCEEAGLAWPRRIAGRVARVPEFGVLQR